MFPVTPGFNGCPQGNAPVVPYCYPVNQGGYPCQYDLPPVFVEACNFLIEQSQQAFPDIFLQSCQRPSENKIYIMFHGTSYAAAKQIIKHGFRPSSDGMLGRGVYLSRDINKAMRYPQNNVPRRVVLKVRVDVGKVKKIGRRHHPLQKTWHDHGFDTAWVPPHCGVNPSGQEEDCVYDPRRIKVVGIAQGNHCDHVRELRRLLHH